MSPDLGDAKKDVRAQLVFLYKYQCVMARITVEDCLVTENNRFSLVQLASKRTKQLLGGSSPKISDRRNKAVVTALREISAGKVRFMTAEEAAAFEEQRLRDLEAARAAGEAERERGAAAQFAGLFTNGSETRNAFESLMATPPPAAPGDNDDEE